MSAALTLDTGQLELTSIGLGARAVRRENHLRGPRRLGTPELGAQTGLHLCETCEKGVQVTTVLCHKLTGSRVRVGNRPVRRGRGLETAGQQTGDAGSTPN